MDNNSIFIPTLLQENICPIAINKAKDKAIKLTSKVISKALSQYSMI